MADELETIDERLLLAYFRTGPRYTSYPTAPEWTDDVGPQQLAEHLAQAADEGPESPLSLYFHIPFCRQRCLYCACNVVVAPHGGVAARYLAGIERELTLVAPMLGERRGVDQLHLGGGTPTYLDVGQLRQLWRSISSHFELLPGAEVALEIDPVVTRAEQLELLAELGFNRLSIGVQDFSEDVQRYVRREQSAELTARVYRQARALGFAGINFDLIYGLPKQRLETFDRTLDTVLELRPDRVAVFSYAHVPWMHRHQRVFDEQLIPQGPAKLRLFKLAFDRLSAAGYQQIGMDHFAVPEDELARARAERRLRRGFQGYTVRQATTLLGFGITAISDTSRCYAQNAKTLADYYRRIESGELATIRGCVLDAEDRLRRHVIQALMCNFAVDLERVGQRFAVDPRATFAAELDQLRQAESHGLLRREGLLLEATPLGRLLIRNIAMVFDSYLRQSTRGELFSKTY